MGRRRLPEYEIRDVSNAFAPAVARRDPEGDPNGKVIVEVDENLKGRARDDAIAAALAPYRQGWQQVVPAPLFAVMWDAGARKLQEHPKVASAVAGAGVVAVVGAAALAATDALDRRPDMVAGSTVTQTATVVHTQSAPTVPSTPPQSPTGARPDRSASPDLGGGREPARQRPEPASRDGRPVPTPDRTAPRRTPPPEPDPTTDATPEERPATASERASTDPPRQPRPQASPDRPRPTRPAATAPPAQPEPEPEPGPSAADCDGLLGVEVGVGDLLGADICLLGK